MPKTSRGQKPQNKLSKSTKVALVYDRVNKWGGAERVLLTLHQIFPEAPLYTSVYEKKSAKWAKEFKEIHPSFLQRLPISKKSHEYLAPLMPLAFESFDFSNFDLVITVSSEAAKGIIVPPNVKHISICLTPTRYLYTGYEDYFTNPILKTFSKPMVGYLKKWDMAASARPDAYIAISKTVQRRIKNIYARKSIVIYPSIAKIFFTANSSSTTQTQKGEYFLVVSRLVGYKKIDLAIQAANALKVPLIIIGDGRRREALEKLAGPTVTFEGIVSEEKLIQRYRNAKALLFPGNEDLGLTMIEAQACGTPVIAYRKGGATELIKEGKTGEFFEDQTVDSLVGVMEKFQRETYNSQNCVKNAKVFSFEKFQKKLLLLINKEI